jgi:hypothetical protein
MVGGYLLPPLTGCGLERLLDLNEPVRCGTLHRQEGEGNRFHGRRNGTARVASREIDRASGEPAVALSLFCPTQPVFDTPAPFG